MSSRSTSLPPSKAIASRQLAAGTIFSRNSTPPDPLMRLSVPRQGLDGKGRDGTRAETDNHVVLHERDSGLRCGMLEGIPSLVVHGLNAPATALVRISAMAAL